ncbi:MAG: undecaprenyl/decaprenyl-phosphate alpha-N-acetylglucosaminyl 1-phosphate transferase, partial [Pedobacter sp.]
QTIAYLSSMLIIFLVGLKDDLLGGAGPYEKLFMQILAVVIMFDFCDLRIFSVSSKELQFYSCLDLAIVVFLMLIVINSFNFIDGINGLSGMIGLVSNLSFGCYTNDSSFALISFSMVGAIAGFLTLNFTKGKVFMGDTGAMLIGFGTAVGAFRFVNMKSDPIAFNGDIGFRLMLVFVLLIIPVLDLIRVTLIRFFHGKSLFVGDRNHIHHKIKDLGFKDTQVVSILMAFNLLMFVVAFKTNEKWPYSWCFILPIIFALCHTVLTFLNGKRRSEKYKFRDVFLKDTLGLH